MPVSGGAGSDVSAILKEYRGALIAVSLLSIALAAVPIVGALFLLLTIDAVLPSHSIPTLTGVAALAAVGLVLIVALAALRTRMQAQLAHLIGTAIRARVDRRLMEAGGAASDAAAVRNAIDHITALAAGRDIPVALGIVLFPVYLIALAALQGWFALVALVAAALIAGIAAPLWQAGPARTAQLAATRVERDAVAALSIRHAGLVRLLGMGPQTEQARARAQAALDAAARQSGAATRDRLELAHGVRRAAMLVTLMLGAGFVIADRASIGTMVAATLLVAQALVPFETVLGLWPDLAAARAGWDRIRTILADVTPARDILPLPVASQRLEVEGLTLTVPEARRIIVRDVSFALKAGDALAIVGPSASGKSALLRGLIGGWPAAAGKVRLDGAALDQWDGETLGRQIGYLPQDAMLFAGTVAQNIARFDPGAGSEAVIAAAVAAGVHDLIVRLPQGYATEVGPDGSLLAAGERQRIALARALFGDPFLLVLDDPGAHLDASVQPLLAAMIGAARARGAIVVTTGNAPAAIETATLLAVLRAGRLEDFGPRDDVRARLLKGPGRPARGNGAAAVPAEGSA